MAVPSAPCAQDLEDEIRRAARMGVELDIHQDGDDRLWIGHVERVSGPPGAGRSVLETICELADDSGLVVALVVENDNPALLIYEALGFERVDPEGRPVHVGFSMMERDPR